MDHRVTPDHYRTLGIARTASQQDVKRAYRELVKRLHPDLDPSPKASERFMAVHQAYETLRDPMLRIAYDAQLRERQKPPERPATHRPHATPHYRQRGTEADLPDINARSWSFIGLHLTGLAFGVLLVMGILTGIAYRHWSWASIFFIVPGLIVIPDAWAGLWLGSRKKRSSSL